MAQQDYRIEYTDDWRTAPMAYWVHIEQDGRHWRAAERYLPAAPAPVAHRGYRVICVEANGVELRFTSRAQLAECARVLALKPLPTTRRLSAIRGTGAGPNGHWLSRLPVAVKSARARPGVVRLLRRVLAAIEGP